MGAPWSPARPTRPCRRSRAAYGAWLLGGGSTKYICPGRSTMLGASRSKRSLKYSASELHTKNDDKVAAPAEHVPDATR
jgi:hypothetical protein